LWCGETESAWNADAYGPILLALDDEDLGAIQGELPGESEVLWENVISTTFSATVSTRFAMRSNLGRRGRSMTNHLIYGMAVFNNYCS
jgi:hypothetical protein